VRRGPVQYFFGISTIVVETAGAADAGEGHTVGNQAIIEGIDNPDEIRRLIMERVRASKSAGLGDEKEVVHPAVTAWDDAHRDALREILDEVRAF